MNVRLGGKPSRAKSCDTLGSRSEIPSRAHHQESVGGKEGRTASGPDPHGIKGEMGDMRNPCEVAVISDGDAADEDSGETIGRMDKAAGRMGGSWETGAFSTIPPEFSLAE